MQEFLHFTGVRAHRVSFLVDRLPGGDSKVTLEINGINDAIGYPLKTRHFLNSPPSQMLEAPPHQASAMCNSRQTFAKQTVYAEESGETDRTHDGH